MLSEKHIVVDDVPSFEVVYRNPRALLDFCKVSVILNGVEYLFQLASKDFSNDKIVFDMCIRTLAFDRGG